MATDESELRRGTEESGPADALDPGFETSASPDAGAFDAEAVLDISLEESLEAGDFTDQRTFSDPSRAAGATGSDPEDPASEGDEVYSPPTDPVLTTDENGTVQVLGGLSGSSMDSIEVAPSALDDRPGDEALARAVRRELKEDAATTGLEVAVTVDQQVAVLRGKVQTLDDVENAEEVAARVPGILEVREHLEVEGL